MQSSDLKNGVSRRTVVRAGANLAWMVPAIAIVTEAPALAVSGQTLQVTGTGSWAVGLGLDVSPGTANITVKNQSTTTAATGVTVVVDFSGNGTLGTINTFSSVNSHSASWSVSPASGSTFTFTFTGSIPANGTVSFSPSFGTLVALSVLGTETAGLTANATGFTQATGSISSSN